MRVLIVAATGIEIAPVVAKLQGTGAGRRQTDSRPPLTEIPIDSRPTAFTYADHDVDVLITGVGMVATAAWCSRVLAVGSYDVALNLGVCGSFDPGLAPGTVVQIRSDRIAELGAEDGDSFVTAQELKLVGDDEFPFTSGQLVNVSPPESPVLRRLPAVDAITVNRVHGNDQAIAAVRERFHPQVESMEGAAFMYACLIHGLRHAQVRAVSNLVEKRNRGAWKLAEAIDSLGRTALDMLDHA
jgi:futalosine hydrolase